MVEQARPRQGPLPVPDVDGAGPEREQAADEVHRLVDAAGGRVRSEVAGAVARQLARPLDAREVVRERDLDVGVALVVLEPDVEARPVALDQVGLEQERLADRVDLGHLEVRNPVDDLADAVDLAAAAGRPPASASSCARGCAGSGPCPRTAPRRARPSSGTRPDGRAGSSRVALSSGVTRRLCGRRARGALRTAPPVHLHAEPAGEAGGLGRKAGGWRRGRPRWLEVGDHVLRLGDEDRRGVRGDALAALGLDLADEGLQLVGGGLVVPLLGGLLGRVQLGHQALHGPGLRDVAGGVEVADKGLEGGEGRLHGEVDALGRLVPGVVNGGHGERVAAEGQGQQVDDLPIGDGHAVELGLHAPHARVGIGDVEVDGQRRGVQVGLLHRLRDA